MICPYSSTSAANGTSNGTSSSGSNSGNTKKSGAIVSTVPRMDALAIIAMAPILGAMAVML